MAQLYVTFLIAAVCISASSLQHRSFNLADSALVAHGGNASTPSLRASGPGVTQLELLAEHETSQVAPPVEGDRILPTSATAHFQTIQSVSKASLLQPRKSLAQSSSQASSLGSSKETVGRAVFLVLFFGFLGAFAIFLTRLLVSYFYIRGTEVGKTWKFRDYVAYRFAYWISWSNWSYSFLIFSMASVFMLIGTAMYNFFVHGSIFVSAWKVFLSLMDPGGGRDETTYAGAFVCGLVSVAGIIFFALLLTFVQERFEQYMRHQTMGIHAVMEKDHVVIIGLAVEGLMLLEELAHAYEKEGGVAIAILSEKLKKPEMEEKIRAAHLDMGRSRIIVRQGCPQYIRGLESVAVGSAKRVILLADKTQEKELRDALIIQCLISISSMGWPEAGRILVECSLVRNKPLFQCLGGDRLDVAMTDAFMSELFIQISYHEGIGRAISNCFSFTGSVFQVVSVPEHLVGKRIIEAAMHYPLAVPVGVIRPGGKCSFGGEFLLKEGEDILLLADCAGSPHNALPEPVQKVALPAKGKVLERRASFVRKERMTPREVENIFIFGWGAFVGILIVHLDYVVPRGTRLVCISPVAEEERRRFLERSQRRWRHTLENITTLEHVVGPIASPLLIDELPHPLENASRIFVLNEPTKELRESDALVVAAVQQIRNLLSEKAIGKTIPIIPEIRDSRSDHHCVSSLALDFLDSSGLPNRFLACAAYDYRLQYAIESMLSAKGDVKFDISSIRTFLPRGTEPPEMLSFAQVQDIVSRQGSVALGWSVGVKTEKLTPLTPGGTELHRTMTRIFEQAHGTQPFHWEVNPPNKTVARIWKETDTVLVFEPLTSSDDTDDSDDLASSEESSQN